LKSHMYIDGDHVPLGQPQPMDRPTGLTRIALSPCVARPVLALPRRRSIRVLVVDDHAVVRQGLKHLLKGEPDIEVVGEAGDGKQALDLVGEVRPDVVTMDINMPVMNGIEATRQIRAKWPEVRVIGLSMFDSRECATIMEEAGVTAYLVKSSAADFLVAVIRECMNLTASGS
jgi:DNA-binding NarL/FixJ family response regulator